MNRRACNTLRYLFQQLLRDYKRGTTSTIYGVLSPHTRNKNNRRLRANTDAKKKNHGRILLIETNTDGTMQSEYQSCENDAKHTLLHAAQRHEPIYSTNLRPAGPNRLHTWVLRSGLIMAGMVFGWMATTHWSTLTKSVSGSPIMHTYMYKMPSNLFREGNIPGYIIRGAVQPEYAPLIGGGGWEDEWYVAKHKVNQVENGHVYVQYTMSSADNKIAGCNLGPADCMVSMAAHPIIQENTNRRGCAFYWRTVDSGCSDVTFRSYTRLG